MKRIQTSKPVRLLRFIYALVACTLIDATVGVALSDSRMTKIQRLRSSTNTLCRMCPAKVSRVYSSNMVPARLVVGPHACRSLLSSMQPFSKERSEVRSMMGRSLLIAPDRASPRCLVIDTALVRMRARPNPRRLLAVFVVDTDEKELTLTPSTTTNEAALE